MDALSVLCAQLTRDVLAIARAVFKGVGRLRDQPPEMLKKLFSISIVFVYIVK